MLKLQLAVPVYVGITCVFDKEIVFAPEKLIVYLDVPVLLIVEASGLDVVITGGAVFV